MTAGGLLRHLLLDHLAIDANREVRASLTFRVAQDPQSQTSMRPEDAIVSVQAAPLLDSAPTDWPRVDMPLDAFLRVRLVSTSVNEFTVADIIRLVSNKMGGMHHKGERGQRLQPLITVAEMIHWDGIPALVTLAGDIAHVTLNGLNPLRMELSARSR